MNMNEKLDNYLNIYEMVVPERLKNDVINKLKLPEFDYNDDYIDAEYPQMPYVKETIDIGRNDPCLCGSGKKYKKCCMNK